MEFDEVNAMVKFKMRKKNIRWLWMHRTRIAEWTEQLNDIYIFTQHCDEHY